MDNLDLDSIIENPGESMYEVFHKAAKFSDLSTQKAEDDFKAYLRGKHCPQYVGRYLDAIKTNMYR